MTPEHQRKSVHAEGVGWGVESYSQSSLPSCGGRECAFPTSLGLPISAATQTESRIFPNSRVFFRPQTRQIRLCIAGCRTRGGTRPSYGSAFLPQAIVPSEATASTRPRRLHPRLCEHTSTLLFRTGRSTSLMAAQSSAGAFIQIIASNGAPQAASSAHLSVPVVTRSFSSAMAPRFIAICRTNQVLNSKGCSMNSINQTPKQVYRMAPRYGSRQT